MSRPEDDVVLKIENGKLRRALEPLKKIADAYDEDRLDEARPSWGRGLGRDQTTELFCGRGGRPLLTLGDALRARQALLKINLDVEEPPPAGGGTDQGRFSELATAVCSLAGIDYDREERTVELSLARLREVVLSRTCPSCSGPGGVVVSTRQHPPDSGEEVDVAKVSTASRLLRVVDPGNTKDKRLYATRALARAVGEELDELREKLRHLEASRCPCQGGNP